MAWSDFESPLGRLTLVASSRGLRALYFPGRAPALDPSERDDESLHAVRSQLEEYFAGAREEFDLALDLEGTAFRRRVWQALREIPYGGTTTYGELARSLGVSDGSGPRPATAAQKVGWAIGAVPVPIVVPCHRIVGADGALIGYLGGLQRKQALLEFESGRSRLWPHRGQLALM
jgi:methylated-DNA-[protein]-cysteine S-methyltransferase